MKEGNFWSSWSPFEKGNRFTYLSLEETLVGGQCFDWHEIEKSRWRGKIEESVVECRWKNNRVEWRCGKKKPLDELKIKEYFWLGEDYDEAVRNLPCRSDPVLEKCVEKLQGLRILRQPLDQSLFFFLLSSAKSIPQIQAVGKAVFQKYGDRLFEDIYSFPGWDRLAEIPESELRSLKLGYRAKYVAESARFISSRSDWLESIPKMSYENAKKELLRLPGVGEKVADCALLFGGNFLEAFPIDTWIEKSMEKRYLLHGWNTKQKLHFAKIHFGRFAGLAQQFLFSAERLKIFNDH